MSSPPTVLPGLPTAPGQGPIFATAWTLQALGPEHLPSLLWPLDFQSLRSTQPGPASRPFFVRAVQVTHHTLPPALLPLDSHSFLRSQPMSPSQWKLLQLPNLNYTPPSPPDLVSPRTLNVPKPMSQGIVKQLLTWGYRVSLPHTPRDTRVHTLHPQGLGRCLAHSRRLVKH